VEREREPARVGVPLAFSLHVEGEGKAAGPGLGAVVEQAGAAAC